MKKALMGALFFVGTTGTALAAEHEQGNWNVGGGFTLTSMSITNASVEKKLSSMWLVVGLSSGFTSQTTHPPAAGTTTFENTNGASSLGLNVGVRYEMTPPSAP